MSKFTKISQQTESKTETKPDNSNDQQIMQTMMSYAPKMTDKTFMKAIYDISKMPSSTPQTLQAKQTALSNLIQQANSDLNNFANYLTKLGIKI
jgi:hypothetical protein